MRENNLKKSSKNSQNKNNVLGKNCGLLLLKTIIWVLSVEP